MERKKILSVYFIFFSNDLQGMVLTPPPGAHSFTTVFYAFPGDCVVTPSPCEYVCLEVSLSFRLGEWWPRRPLQEIANVGVDVSPGAR